MSAVAAVLTRSWPVGDRVCTLTVAPFKPGTVVQAVAEWTPDEPSRLSTAEWQQYRAGRNHALAEIASEMGIRVAVLDL